jgi:hypothetical protein
MAMNLQEIGPSCALQMRRIKSNPGIQSGIKERLSFPFHFLGAEESFLAFP